MAGVIAFGIHEAAMLGNVAGLADWVFAGLNSVWAKAIGHPEDPTKARIDRDAAKVVAKYVNDNHVPAGVSASVCKGRAGYVNWKSL